MPRLNVCVFSAASGDNILMLWHLQGTKRALKFNGHKVRLAVEWKACDKPQRMGEGTKHLLVHRIREQLVSTFFFRGVRECTPEYRNLAAVHSHVHYCYRQSPFKVSVHSICIILLSKPKKKILSSILELLRDSASMLHLMNKRWQSWIS